MRKRRHPFAFLPFFFILLAIVVVSYICFTRALVTSNLVIEAGSAMPEAGDFITSDLYRCEYAGDVSNIDTAIPGEYDLMIRINKRKFNVSLIINDTTPPSARAVSREIWQGRSLEADQFVADLSDISDISYAFKVPPDFDRPGQQNVTVVLTDAFGNQSEITASLTILFDDEDPVISGVVDQSVYAGEPISYKTGVTVTDNHDPDVKLEIDNSAVDLNTPGTYTVIYSAVDQSGNRTEVSSTVTVLEKPAGYVSEYDLNLVIDEVFAQILAPGMSDLERISEIFYWIADHIDYTGTSDKSDWIKAAYLGITRGTGDCYNYYATAKAMLIHAGYECISIMRRPGAMDSNHYWNLVKYNGEWYHFDPLPQLRYYHYVCLLRTDAEVAEYSTSGQKGFYEYDHDGIPATATEPLDIERKLIYG